MRLWFKLLVALTGSALMTGNLAEAQNRLLMAQVTHLPHHIT
jgi:hypothetical protein